RGLGERAREAERRDRAADGHDREADRREAEVARAQAFGRDLAHAARCYALDQAEAREDAARQPSGEELGGASRSALHVGGLGPPAQSARGGGRGRGAAASPAGPPGAAPAGSPRGTGPRGARRAASTGPPPSRGAWWTPTPPPDAPTRAPPAVSVNAMSPQRS